MTQENSQKDTIKDSGDTRKTVHDYTGQELDRLRESDPELYERLWREAELEALNNPDNHDKSN